MSRSKKKTQSSAIAVNRKSWHDYTIGEQFEAGIVLEGWEVKSIHSPGRSLPDRGAHLPAGQRFNPCHSESGTPQKTVAAQQGNQQVDWRHGAGRSYHCAAESVLGSWKSETQNRAGQREKTIRQTPGNQTAGLGQTEAASFQERWLNLFRPMTVHGQAPARTKTPCAF